MAAPQVRRADFLMTLAYATDLATGRSRDFLRQPIDTMLVISIEDSMVERCE
jgi:hypothetical protein